MTNFASGSRPPAVAGSFYPRNPDGLKTMLEDFFKHTKKLRDTRKLKALIVPHAGWIYSGTTAAWGYQQLPSTSDQYFVLIGPSHFYTFSGLAASKSNFWQTPLGKVKHVPAQQDNQVFLDDEPHEREHCLEVQLPFLQSQLKNFSISCFLTGFDLDTETAAKYFLRRYPQSIFIISSDLSHYLPEEVARAKDNQTLEAIINGNQKYFNDEENVACGAAGIQILMNMAKIKNWKAKLVYYDTSASASGNKFEVVGYAAIGFYEKV